MIFADGRTAHVVSTVGPGQIRNNKSELVGEINTVVRPGERVIISSTVYSGEHIRPHGDCLRGKIGPLLLFAQGEWATVRDGSE